MFKNTRPRALLLALAALLLVGGCDDEKKPEVEVHVPKGVEVKVKRIDKDDMVIAGELALLSGLAIWALFGPGAGRRREPFSSEDRQETA